MTEADSLDREVKAWLDFQRVERGASTNTIEAYARDARRYCAFLQADGIATLSDVTERHLEAFARSLREGSGELAPLSVNSANRTIVAIRGLHRFHAGEKGAEDIAASLSPPRAGERLPKALSRLEVESLLRAAASDDVRNYAIAELLYGTGARVSEVTGLDLDDVDLESRAIRLRGKGNKERVVPLGSYAVDAIGAYLTRVRPAYAGKGISNGALFLNQRGRRLTRQAIFLMLRRYAQVAGLTQEISPHTLRHSYATHLLEGGADVRVVQELLGHASVTTTQIYTKVSVQQLRETFSASHPRAR